MVKAVVEAIKKTFETLEKKGVACDLLYQEAEKEDKFDIDFDEVFDKIGVKVEFERGLRDKNGNIVSGYSDVEKQTIYVNADECSERKRFTIGHELYHILNSESRNRDGQANEQERLANSFSAEFLMPEEYLERKFAEFNYDRVKLTRYFGVSLEAMGYRLLNLGLIMTL